MSKKTASEVLNEEWDEFMENISEELQEAFIELQETDEDNHLLNFVIGEDEHVFKIKFDEQYPKAGNRLSVITEDPKLSDWKEKLQQIIDKSAKAPKLSQVLEDAAQQFLSVVGGSNNNNKDDDENLLEEDEEEKPTKPKKSKEEQEIQRKIDSNEFLTIGSPQATLRILNDLKNIKKQDPNQLGFSAEPVMDQKSGMENLYHWNIKLFGFDEDSDLAKDLKKYAEVSGQEFVLLEMRFSKDYPHLPPFVRVVKPRFQFKTGHVTVGGSICMELLTNSGWNATNDIESILIQIRAEMGAGGARLDPGMAKDYEYSEQEAWEAFHRAAKGHKWDTNGLGKDMFPKIDHK